MGVKEFLQRLGEKQRQRKALIKEADEQLRVEKIVTDRQKSSNERELQRFVTEEREELIKEQLEFMRKRREKDIRFNHNPLDVPNITNHVDWEVMKERNMFKGNRNMFSNNEFIHKDSPNLFKNNRSLFSI